MMMFVVDKRLCILLFSFQTSSSLLTAGTLFLILFFFNLSSLSTVGTLFLMTTPGHALIGGERMVY